MKKITGLTGLFTVIALVLANTLFAQPDRWQQRAEYDMDIKMNVKKNTYKGKQKLTYYNNSPDVLTKVYYHLYFNAFQPGSMMDVRSTTIKDPDPRVRDRISKLKEDQYGYQKIKSLTQDGQKVKFEVVGTILEVELAKPIQPNSKTIFEMEWKAQVPLQIRRSGRDNKEGIRYSMTQWYPKLCEYDYQGWHANPYIGREFHGVWGDFDVKITIDSDYMIGSTGVLQNAQEIGKGFQDAEKAFTPSKKKKLTWHFRGENIHDFAWAADPDYTHVTAQVPDGPTLHFFYQKGEETKEWEKLPEYTIKAFEYISKNFGKYPYPVYSVIQGGDGGMEYPQATLITGHRKLRSLVGVTVHEVFHSWYQMILGTNESLYAWMDEGFTTYGSNITMAHLFEPNPDGVHAGSYNGYYYLAKSGLEEPMSTHSDHYERNLAYSLASYSKGAVLMAQLGYIIGQDNLEKGILKYFDTWKFKHPNVNDFIRVMEQQSGLELDWYKEYFVFTTKTIDYNIKAVAANAKKKKRTDITIHREGLMPMPIDVMVTYADDTKELFHIPLRIMRGEKPVEDTSIKTTTLEDWAWTNRDYTFTIKKKLEDVVKIEIDPSNRLADIKGKDNIWEKE